MNNKEELNQHGFSVMEDVYSSEEVENINNILDNYSSTLNAEKVDSPIHAIRRVLQKIPSLASVLFNEKLLNNVKAIGDANYFLTKSMYFDKPENSNWFVSYHQDISISVKERIETVGYDRWTKKSGQFGVVPPREVLENIITFRVHLDDTDESNGALNLIPSSHLKGIQRIENVISDNEISCAVKEGSVMIMKPLTFHSSKRSSQGKRRRVLHLEFSNLELKSPLKWLERQP